MEDKIIKTMKAPDYFLEILAYRKPVVEKLKKMGIEIEGKKGLGKKELEDFTMKEIEEIEVMSNLYRTAIKFAWAVFRFTDKSEFGDADHLDYEPKNQTINIVEGHHGTEGIIDALKQVFER